MTIQHGELRETFEITRGEFERLTADLMERTQLLCEEVLGNVGMSWDQLTGVLLVGGSTRMPMVHEYVRRMSGKPPALGVNVDEVVALGARSRRRNTERARANALGGGYFGGGPDQGRDEPQHGDDRGIAGPIALHQQHYHSQKPAVPVRSLAALSTASAAAMARTRLMFT